MGKNQKVILIIYAAAIVLMCLIPPYEWQVSTRYNGSGYYPLWSPPSRGVISVQFLGIQILVATLVAGALWLTAGGSSEASASPTKQSAPILSVKTKRTVIAAIVCLIAVFAYMVATNALFGWRHGGGAIGMGILSMIVWGIWSAIRGSNSPVETPPVPIQSVSSPPNPPRTDSTQLAPLAAGVSAVSTPPPVPLPTKTPVLPSPELSAFELLAAEKAKSYRHEALWLKCHAEANGEPERAEAAYNKQRAQMLMAELLASQEASRDEVRARLADWRSSVTNANLQLQVALKAARSLKTVSRQHETFVGIKELQNARTHIDEALSFFLTKTDLLKREIAPNEWEGNLPKPQFASASEVPDLLPWQECMKIVSDEQTKAALVNGAQAALASVDKLISKRQAQIELLSELSAKVRHKAKRRDILKSADKFYNSCRFADVDYTELDEFNSRQSKHDSFAIAMFLAVFLTGAVLLARHQTSKQQEPAPLLQPSEALLSSQGSSEVAPSTSETPPVPPSNVAESQKEPFMNSLGMKFVPVPGTSVLMCIHETRNEDYAVYAASQSGVNTEWREEAGSGKDQHPVVKVSYEDAEGFCRWLSAKEGKTYRLPTDSEWSAAVGLQAEIGQNPAEREKSLSEEIYPWGSYYPPKPEDGNYSGGVVNDGYDKSAPVLSFGANILGIYDLGGNVWEWCQDWYDDQKYNRVLRGASWFDDGRVSLRSSHRSIGRPEYRLVNGGFRCVLLVAGEESATAPLDQEAK